MRASNTRGAGPWTDPISFTTGLPRQPVVDLTPGGTEITATWATVNDEDDEGDVLVTSYTLQYRDATTETAEWTQHSVTDATLTRTITGLTTTTEYEVRVKATNGRGDGAWSVVVSQIAGAPIAPVMNLTTPGDGQATVTWAAPTTDAGDAVIDYDLEYRLSYPYLIPTWTPHTTDADDDPSDSSTLETALTRDVSGLTNGTSYQVRVRAQNGRGESPCSEPRRARPGTPLAPTGLSLIAGNEKIAVSWTAPTETNGNDITGYALAIQEPHWDHYGLRELSGTATEYVYRVFNRPYNVKVAAINDHGIGLYTAQQQATPGTTAPDKPTVSLTAGDTQLTASWSVADDGGETISQHIVRHRVKTDPPGGNWTQNSVAGPPTTSFTIGNLTNDTEYEVEVNARNSEGTGDWSDTVSGTPTTAAMTPGAPRNLTLDADDAEIEVNWGPPASTGTQPIASYDVRCKLSSETHWPSEFCAENVEGETTALTDLTNGSSYDVAVRATNSAGDGPWTAAAMETPVTTPSAPQNLEVTAGDAQIEVEGDPPSSNGGSAITGYEVHYLRGGAWYYQTVNGTPVPTQHTLSYLTNGRTYKVKVRALNAEGDGDDSAVKEATPVIAPEPPMLWAKSGDGEITLSWAVNTTNGVVNLYRLWYQPKGGEEVRLNLSNTNTSYTLEGLTNDTEYEIKLKARNTGGFSEWSETITATPAAAPQDPTRLEPMPMAFTAGVSQTFTLRTTEVGNVWVGVNYDDGNDLTDDNNLTTGSCLA